MSEHYAIEIGFTIYLLTCLLPTLILGYYFTFDKVTYKTGSQYVYPFNYISWVFFSILCSPFGAFILIGGIVWCLDKLSEKLTNRDN